MNFLRKHYFIIFLFIYLFFVIITYINAFNIASEIQESFPQFSIPYYWLNYKVSFIQFGNNMIIFSGVLSCAFGVFIPIKKRNNKKDIDNIIQWNFLYTLSSAIFSFVVSFIISSFLIKSSEIVIHFNLFFRSICMLTGYFLYMTFWSLFGYSLKTIFKRRIIIFTSICLVQYIELFLLKDVSFYKLNLFLPTSLSRELVVKQFPFWKEGNWSNIPGVFPLGNVTMMHNEFYELIDIPFIWVLFMLSLFLIIPFFISYKTIKLNIKQKLV